MVGHMVKKYEKIQSKNTDKMLFKQNKYLVLGQSVNFGSAGFGTVSRF